MIRARRRLMGPRRWRALAVVAVVGTVAVLIYGFAHRNDPHPGSAPATTVPRETSTTVPCPAPVHSEEGAARTAAEGLYALAQVNMKAPGLQVDQTLQTFVVPERWELMRQFFQKYPSPFVAGTSTPVGWTTVTYSPQSATIRLVTDDRAVSPSTTVQGRYVTQVVLAWNAPANTWRLADWPAVKDPGIVGDVLAHAKPFCDGPTG